MFSASGNDTTAPVNIVIFRRQLKRATRQLWLFSVLSVVDALLVLDAIAAGDAVTAIQFGILEVILVMLTAYIVPYRNRLKRAIARAEAI
jgi:hypothetical protein